MTNSQRVLDGIFKKEIPFKKMAKEAVRNLYIPSSFPGGTRIFTPKMQGTVWGKPHQLTMSLLKTDVFDRRFVVTKPRQIDEVVRGAFSEANKDFDDMPHSGLIRARPGILDERGGRRIDSQWASIYPFPCIKSVGQFIIQAEDFKEAKQQDGRQSLSNGAAGIHVENSEGACLSIDYLISMKRTIVAVNAAYSNLTRKLSFRLYRNQDQGHRKYMDKEGNYIPENERKVVFTPADPTKPSEYYDLEADADINGPFEPPRSGTDGRFFWISQKFPAEATFPEGFEYVMMGLASEPRAFVCGNKLQKGLGTEPRMPKDSSGGIIVEEGIAKSLELSVGQASDAFSFLFRSMEASYELARNAPGAAATAQLPEAGTGSVRVYIAVVTANEADDIYAEARKQLLDAEKVGFDALAEENRDWYDAMYDKREAGRITISTTEEKKCRIDRIFLDDTFASWGIQDGGYCDPDPRKYEGCEMYANYDTDIQHWHSLPCYNEVYPTPWMVRNRHEPLLYYCRLIEAWHAALKQKARDQYGLPGMIMPHGYLPPAKPHPWYIESQVMDMCLEVAAQVLKVLWDQWDYRADEEMLKSLIYPAVRDLAIFYEAYCRRNYDGKYYNIIPVVESENWGISYGLKYAYNTTAAITMFRKILNCAIEAAGLLGVGTDLIPGWREVAENLPPYAKFKVSSGEVLAGNPGVMPRYTMGDHGYTADFVATLSDETNLDSLQEDKDLLVRSLDTTRTGWSRLGYILVGKFKDHIPCSIEDPAILIDTDEMLATELISRAERLLNSRSGRIHLFPVLPDWAEAAFRGFLARGGFVCSAARDKDGVKAVLIKARRSIPCRVMNPWAGITGRKCFVTDLTANRTVGYELNTDNGECIIFPTEAGHDYSIDLE